MCQLTLIIQPRRYLRTIRQVVTNVKTLSEIISFVETYNVDQSSQANRFDEFDCLMVSLYKKDSSITRYKLHSSETYAFVGVVTNKGSIVYLGKTWHGVYLLVTTPTRAGINQLFHK